MSKTLFYIAAFIAFLITIADVADLLGIRRLPGGTEDMFGAECPFCGDARGKCNFCVMRDGPLPSGLPGDQREA